MAKKQKLLKNLLTSVSVASIVASIGGSSGAFAFNLGDGPLVNLSGVVGFGGAGPGARELNFNRPGVTLTVDIKKDIADIITTEAGNIIIAESMAITGAVAPPLAGPNSATATINDNKTLTLSGVNHIGLGAVTLNGTGSTLLLKHTAILPAAAVITTNADGKGILTFNETGTVTGNIGTNAAALAQINIGDDDAAGGDVILQGDVFTRRLVFNNASEVKIAGNFGGGDNAIAGASAVDFGTGGMLTFNGGRGAGDLKTFNATIDNGANGALNVLGRLKAIHANIGNIQTINIGDADEGYLTIDASAGNVKLLGDGGGAVQEINFGHANSVLGLYTNTDHTITFYDHLPGTVGNTGIVLLEGAGGHTLTVDSDGAKTLGTAAQLLTRLDVRGQVTIAGSAANGLDLQHVPELNVIKGAVFTDESRTSATIPTINIGVENPNALVAADRVLLGPAAYVLDAKYADFNLIGNNINFSHEDGRLILRNSDNTGVLKTITLANTLNPGNAANGKGIVELNSVAGGLLKITKAAAHSLGTNLNKLKEVEFSGAGDITIEPIIYAHTITSNATGTVTTNDLCGNVTLNANGQLKGDVTGGVAFAAAGQLTGNVNGHVGFYANGIVSGDVTGIVTVNGGNSTVGGSIGSVAFTGNGQLTSNKGVAGEVDFNNQTGTVTVAHQKTIGGTIKNGEKATVEFARDGAVTNVIEKLKLLKAGNGNVTLGAGKHTIEEIQGNGTQTLTFADKFNSTGAINKTGGAAVRTPSQSEGLDGYEQPKGLPLLIKILLIRQSLNYQVALDS